MGQFADRARFQDRFAVGQVVDRAADRVERFAVVEELFVARLGRDAVPAG
ncbi:hypothetical protein LFM09_04345 [Lentzea alba]